MTVLATLDKRTVETKVLSGSVLFVLFRNHFACSLSWRLLREEGGVVIP